MGELGGCEHGRAIGGLFFWHGASTESSVKRCEKGIRYLKAIGSSFGQVVSPESTRYISLHM